MGRQLVPITRDVLRAFYSKYPLQPVPQDQSDALHARLDAAASAVAKQGSKTGETVYLATPTRIDDCFWRTRQFCEEIAESLENVCKELGEKQEAVLLGSCISSLRAAERTVNSVQESNTEAAAAQIRQFLPQDFRASLLEMKRSSQEARNKRAVQDLLKRGGTVRQKYELFLQQQWERREALVQMGNLSGVYKFAVKYLGGIPQVLLDFAKEINAKLGPMEEQRLRYGPDLYIVATLGIKLNVLAALWAENLEGSQQHMALSEVAQLVSEATAFYTAHLTRVVSFLGDIFIKSPFFITKEEAEAAGGDTSHSDPVVLPALESSTTVSAAWMDHTDEETDDGMAHMTKCGGGVLSAMLSPGHHAGAEHAHHGEHGERTSHNGVKSSLDSCSKKATSIEKAIKSLITPKYGRGSHDGDRDSAGRLHVSNHSIPVSRTHSAQSQPAGGPTQPQPQPAPPLSPDGLGTYSISATAAANGSGPGQSASSVKGVAGDRLPGGADTAAAAAGAPLPAPRAAQSVSLPAPLAAPGQRAQVPPALLLSAGLSTPIPAGPGTAPGLMTPGQPQVLGRCSTGVPPASLSRTSWVTEYMSCVEDNTSWVSSIQYQGGLDEEQLSGLMGVPTPSGAAPAGLMLPPAPSPVAVSPGLPTIMSETVLSALGNSPRATLSPRAHNQSGGGDERHTNPDGHPANARPAGGLAASSSTPDLRAGEPDVDAASDVGCASTCDAVPLADGQQGRGDGGDGSLGGSSHGAALAGVPPLSDAATAGSTTKPPSMGLPSVIEEDGGAASHRSAAPDASGPAGGRKAWGCFGCF